MFSLVYPIHKHVAILFLKDSLQKIREDTWENKIYKTFSHIYKTFNAHRSFGITDSAVDIPFCVYDDCDWRSEVMDMTYSPFQYKQFYPHPLFCVTL